MSSITPAPAPVVKPAAAAAPAGPTEFVRFKTGPATRQLVHVDGIERVVIGDKVTLILRDGHRSIDLAPGSGPAVEAWLASRTTDIDA